MSRNGWFTRTPARWLNLAPAPTAVINAGLPTAYLVGPDGEIVALGSGNLPLGILPDDEFETKVHVPKWVDDAQLVVYTDGLTESCNADQEMFGTERLLAVCRANSCQNLAKSIGEAHSAFLDGTIALDDVSVLSVDIKSLRPE